MEYLGSQYLINAANKYLALNALVGAAFGGETEVFMSYDDNALANLIISGWSAVYGNISWYATFTYTLFVHSSIIAILVGEAQSWLPEIVEKATKLKVNGGFEADADLYVRSMI